MVSARLQKWVGDQVGRKHGAALLRPLTLTFHDTALLVAHEVPLSDSLVF